MQPRSLLLTLSLALVLHPPLEADEVRLRSGETLRGRLVTMVFQSQDGVVHELHSPELTLFLPASSGPPAPPVAQGPSFGTRTPVGVPAPAPSPLHGTSAVVPNLPADQPGLDIELLYQAPTQDPEQSPPTDKLGDRAEVFVYRAEQEKNRGAWIRLGDAVRVEDLTMAHFTPEQECALLQERIRDPELTREEILAELDRSRTFTHRMRYVFRKSVDLEDGPWVVYVNFSRIRRHRIWRGVRFDSGQPVQLRYSWSSIWGFGR